MSADIERLKNDICARAELYLIRVAERVGGEPLYGELVAVAEELEPLTGVEDDWKGVALAFDYHCDRSDLPRIPKARLA